MALAVPGSVRLPSDGTILGTISPSETADRISLAVVAGQTYSVALRGVGDARLADPVLGLYDENGNFLNSDDDGGAGATSLLTFTATATGTYTLTAQPYSAGDVGDYSVDIWQQRETDQVPATFEGAVEIAVGTTTFGHIETGGDVDRYKIYLKAGKLYTFELAGGADYNTDKNNVPTGELDTVLAIYDADGIFRGAVDDRAGDDLSAVVTTQVPNDGYYYLDFLGYSGQTGGYTFDVTARDIVPVDPSLYDPLDAFDWVNAANIPTTTVNGVKTAYVYFGDPDENFDQTGDDGASPMVTIDWNAFEKQQVMLALGEFSKILGITYVVTDNVDQATFRLLKTESAQYGAYFFPQDPAYGDSQGVGVFNVVSGGWNFGEQQSLLKGGYSFSVILHEFGHAHGLAHPHDNGGGSEVMLGVTDFSSPGLFDLNQGVYTVMSYRDAWQDHPDGPTPFTRDTIGGGRPGTLSAFDIAVLQERYGVVARATGNDVYRMGDANGPGTFYQTIWDSAGTDEIRYDGARAAQIDLTAATLDYTPTGGGVVSFVDDIWGGYTIAGGVVIENATGGSGNDILIGNAVANVLLGNAGDDMLMARGGADTLNGGAGFDTVSYMDATEAVRVRMGNGGNGSGADGDQLIGIEKVEGSAFADTLDGGNGADTLSGLAGDDRITGGNGDDDLTGAAGMDTLSGGNGADILEGGDDNDVLDGGNDNDTLRGGAGADSLSGGNGVDVLAGGGGDDQLRGGNGNDRFVFASDGGTDTILDFRKGDRIDLSAFAGVDRGDVTISAGRIFVENGDADVTILVQGDRPTDLAFLFAQPALDAAVHGHVLMI